MATISRVQTVLTGVAGSPYYQSLYFPFTVEPEDAVAAANDLWEIFASYVSDNVAWLVDGVVVNLNDATGEIIGSVSVDGITGAGTSVQEELPSSTQVLVQWRTGVYVGGREIRGRTFVPAITEPNNEDGHFNETGRSELSDAIALWLGGLAEAPLIWSRAHGQSAPIAAAQVWSQFAVLRSRRD